MQPADGEYLSDMAFGFQFFCGSLASLKVGLMSNRSVEDETLVQAIRCCNSSNKTVYIVDPRPAINSLANLASGFG